MAVFVLAKNKKPLMPCSEKRARLLLSRNQAVVHKRFPFTIRLKKETRTSTQPITVKLDPGSQFTGVAVVLELEKTIKVASLFELQHRGYQISEALTQRRAFRRRRRNQLRYRAPRFLNRTKKVGWLPPSVQHRIDSTMSIVNKIKSVCPVVELAVEVVKFDMQKMQSPDIQGIEYQQGTLFQYEVKEYLLIKHRHTCAYCSNESNDPILETEHKHPRAKGGSNSVNNLVLSCRKCNIDKGAMLLTEWLKKLGKSKLDKVRKINIEKIIAGKAFYGLKDAAAVNAGRNALLAALLKMNIPVATGTGAQTKFNRHNNDIPKTHALDALCVGEINKNIVNWHKPALTIKAMGRGSYQRTRLDKFGFPRAYLQRKKQFFGFQTGDLISVDVKKGKKIGQYAGRVAVRASGSFNIQTGKDVIQGISYRYCQLVQRNDGYHYFYQPKIAA